MVFLLIAPSALQETLEMAKRLGGEVWLGADALTEQHYQELLSNGYKLTRFVYALSAASPEVIEEALLTIQEHHPGEVIWVQHVGCALC